MKWFLSSLILVVMLISFSGCQQNISEKVYENNISKLIDFQEKMSKVRSQGDYEKLIQEIKPEFDKMDAQYSDSFNDKTLIMYAKYAGLAGEYQKAADSYILIINRNPDVKSDSLLLPAAMACFYSGKNEKAIELMEKSIEFGVGDNIQMKDYLLSLTLKNIAVSSSSQKTEDFISKVKNKITTPLRAFDEQVKSIKVIGSSAPKFENINNWINTKKITSNKLKGKVYLIDFWATWCGPCRMATPKMVEIYEQFKENKNFYLIGLTKTYGNYSDGKKNLQNISPQKERALIADFVKEHNMPYPVAIAKDDKNLKNFGINGIPAFYLVGKNGKIINNWVGYSDDQFEQMKLLIQKELSK